ncbi:MAG: tetratricopeptide repeat protein, partial [Bacteroidales bacterium]
MRMKQLLFVTLLIISPKGFGQADPYLAGRALMTKGAYDSAVICLNQALESRPGDADLYYYVGLAQFSSNNFPAAEQALYEAERRRKGMASFYLAKTEVKLNHPEQALKYLQSHLESRYKKPESEILLDEDLSTLQTHPGWNRLWEEKRWYSMGDEAFQEAVFLKESGDHLEAINMLNELEKKGYE